MTTPFEDAPVGTRSRRQPLLQFSISNILLTTVLVAVSTCWVLDRQRLQRELAKRPPQAATPASVTTVPFAHLSNLSPQEEAMWQTSQQIENQQQRIRELLKKQRGQAASSELFLLAPTYRRGSSPFQ